HWLTSPLASLAPSPTHSRTRTITPPARRQHRQRLPQDHLPALMELDGVSGVAFEAPVTCLVPSRATPMPAGSSSPQVSRRSDRSRGCGDSELPSAWIRSAGQDAARYRERKPL